MEQTIRHSAALPRSFALGGYVIEDQLGTGGFGITYSATVKLIPSKRVAIKEYLPVDIAHRLDISTVRPNSAIDQGSYADGLNRFIKEATHLWRLSNAQQPHKNIVPIEYVFEDNGTAYIVMDLLHGETLTQHIDRRDTFTEQRIRPIVEQLLDALDFIHDHDILHRDIAPTNIVLTPGDVPVLIDFGAASDDIKQVTPRTVVVKDGYSPIEQEEGSAQDVRSDIYAMAATLYHLITGEKPVRVLQRLRGIREVNTDPMPSAREICYGRYSERFLSAIDAGLAIYPEGRPTDVAAWRRLFFAPADPEVTVPMLGRMQSPQPRAQLQPQQSDAPTEAIVQPRQGGNGRPAKKSNLGKTVGRTAAALAVVAGVIAGALLLVPDYDDHIGNAHASLAKLPLTQQSLLEAREEFASALEEKPADAIAADGQAGVEQLLALFDATTAGNLAEAQRSLDAARVSLTRAGLTTGQLSPFQTRLDQTRLALMTIDALRRENLPSARRSIDDVHALPTADTDHLKQLEAAYDELENVDRLLTANQFQQAYAAVDAGEQALLQIGYRAPSDLRRWRDAIAARTGRWLYDARLQTNRRIHDDPLDAQALSTARDFFTRQAKMDPDSSETGVRLIELLTVAMAEVGRQAQQIPDEQTIVSLAAELGLPDDFDTRLRQSFRKKNAARGIAPPVAGAILDALQGLTAQRRVTLETLTSSHSALRRVNQPPAPGVEFTADDARIQATSLAIVAALIDAKRTLERGEFAAVGNRLQRTNAALGNVEPTVEAMLSHAFDSVETDHENLATTMLAIDKMVSQFSPAQVAEANGQFTRVLRSDPGNRFALAGQTVTGHLETGLNAGAACDLDATRRAYTNARIAWIFEADTEFIDRSFGAIRRSCR